MNETLKITRFVKLVDKQNLRKVKIERKFAMPSKLSERTLRKWRKEALQTDDNDLRITYRSTSQDLVEAYIKAQQKILRLTQELLDNHLLSK